MARLIVSETTRLPQALTGIALRVEHFTVTKMSTCRWQIDIPNISQTAMTDLLEVLPTHVVEVHHVDPH
jgi:hypothetical protein